MADEGVDDLDLLEGDETEYASLLVMRGAARDFFGSKQDMASRIVQMSSVRPTFGEQDVRNWINDSRADVRRMVDEYVPGANPLSLRVGSMMGLRDLVQLRLDLGIKATKSDLKPKTPSTTIIRGGLATRFGLGLVDEVTGGLVDRVAGAGAVDKTSTTDGLVDRRSQTDGTVDRLANWPEEKVVAHWPAIPKHDLVLADAMSTISVLANPKFPSLTDIEVMLSEATEKDPFARAALSGPPEWLRAINTKRYGSEARRILQQELRFDLSYQGFDYSNFSVSTERLDPARRRVVDAMRSYALAAAKVGRYQLSGEFSFESPLGFNLTGGSLLQDPGLPAASAGLARRTLSRAMDPYFIDVVNPLMDWAFPGRYGPVDARGVRRTQMGGQDRGSGGPGFLANATNFLSSWAFPVIGARDATGSHWMPGGSPSLASARTASAFRQMFGAPKMSAILDDEGLARLVSLKKVGDSYSRDIFFLYAGGDAGWNTIRQNFVLSRIRNPVLSPNSQIASAKAIGGEWTDDYTGEVHQIADVFQLTYLREVTGKKNGKDVVVNLLQRLSDANADIRNGIRSGDGVDTVLARRDIFNKEYNLGAPIKAPYQVDHVLALDWAYEHGGAELFAAAVADPYSEKAKSILLAFAHIGSGVNPDQFALTSAEMNRVKSSKGPDQWAPHWSDAFGFSHADNELEHRQNLAYIRRFLSVQASGQRAMQDALGYRDPDYLAMTRSEQLAVLGIQRGYDMLPERIRPFYDFWLGYYEQPDLLGETFHRRVNATSLMGAGGLAYALAAWKLTPFNQLYLLGRSIFVPAYTAAWTAKSGARTAAAMRSVRSSFGGLPLLGRGADASDPVKVARFLRRGGRLIENIDVETGVASNIHKSSISYMTWRQGVDYGWGRPNALGEASTHANVTKAGKLTGRGQRFTPLTGRGRLNPSAFVEDLVHAIAHKPKGTTRLSKVARIFTAEGIIKFVDYGVVRGNFGLMVDPQMFTILGIEALASKSSAYSGVTGVELNPFEAPNYGAGGFRGYWKRARADQRTEIRKALAAYREASAVPRSTHSFEMMKALRYSWLRKDIYTLEQISVPTGQMHRRVKGVEYMSPVPGAYKKVFSSFEDDWTRFRNESIWRDVEKMGFLPDPARMRTPDEYLEQTREFNRLRVQRVQEARRELKLQLLRRASVSRDLNALDGAFDLLNAPRGFSRAMANIAATYPRLPAIAGRLTHVPNSLRQVAVAPFKMAKAVGEVIHRNPLLRGSLDVAGIGFNALGWYESVGRNRYARQLNRASFDSLNREQKAELDAYLHPEGADFFWDVGWSALGLVKPNPLSVIDATMGISLAAFNQAAPRAMLLDADPRYMAERNLRILQNRPTLEQEERERRRRKSAFDAGLRRADDYRSRYIVNLQASSALSERMRSSGLPTLSSADMTERIAQESWTLDSARYVALTEREGSRTGQTKQAAKKIADFVEANTPRKPHAFAPDVVRSPLSLMPFGTGMRPVSDALNDSSLISGLLRRASNRLSDAGRATGVTTLLDSMRVRRERSAHREDVADAAAFARLRNPTLRKEASARANQELATRMVSTRMAETLRMGTEERQQARFRADSLDLARSIACDSLLRGGPRSMQAVPSRIDTAAWRRGNRM